MKLTFEDRQRIKAAINDAKRKRLKKSLPRQSRYEKKKEKYGKEKLAEDYRLRNRRKKPHFTYEGNSRICTLCGKKSSKYANRMYAHENGCAALVA